MSDWVNWGEYAALQEPEIQRMANETQQAEAAQQSAMDAALGNLSSEANRRAREGNFQGVQALGGYGEVMKARDRAQAAAPRAVSPLEKPAWESDLVGDRDTTYDDPWAKLGGRLAAGTNKAQAQNTRAKQDNARRQQEAERQRFNAEQKAKTEAAFGGRKLTSAEQYTQWSDAVADSAERSGGYGAGAWYDAQQGYGPGPETLYASPRTKKTQRIGYATPTNTDSNFGLNSGYSSGNDWNF